METKIISVVTGASGFVGSHLVDYLISKGHYVKCLLRKSSSKKWLEGKPVEIVDCGLFDTESLSGVLRSADYLYHIAGVVKAKTYDEYLHGNVETTRILLDVLLKVNPKVKRVVIASSFTACGPSYESMTCNEETKEHPLTRYGKSKLEQELLAKQYMGQLPITIIRPPAVFGPRDTEIYLFFKTYKAGLMSLIGYNNKLLNLIYIDDLIVGLYLASINEKAAGQIYYIASEEMYTWPQIGDVIANAFGRKAFTIRIPHFIVYIVAAFAQFFSMFSSKAATFNIEKARDFVQQYWTCDVSKAKRELGFKESYSLEESMKLTIDWYREMKWL
ncbi:MAG: NAD(P)-dependent oxidoreductase [Ignavibacteria bacterium]|nr:NAD(P)-dependent oxidoreductase [Ignavibacteria bacterium]